MTKNTTLALFSAVFFFSLIGCGSNDPNPPQSCSPGSDPSVAMNCYTPDTDTSTTIPEETGGTTGTATSTDTGTGGSTTGTSTSTATQLTATSTSTGTGTASNTPVTLTLSNGGSCDPGTDPREAAAGGILDLSNMWKMVTADGKEVILKAKVDTYGIASACGIPTGVASPTPTHWKGVSTKKCISWTPDSTGTLGSNAPWVQGTGIVADTTDPAQARIVGGNPNIKIFSIPYETIVGCP